MNWVTVIIVHTEIEANLKKGFLEDAGIPCLLESRDVHPYPFLSEFKINVPVGYREQAEEILRREIE